MSPDNAELLAKAVQGDHASWSTLVERYHRLVWSVTGTYRLDPAQRDDINQTVWLKLYEKADTIRDPDRLAGWLCTVARNEALRLVRQQSRLVSNNDYIDLVEADEADIDLVEAADEHETAVQAFARLDQRCRELLTLVLQELAYTDIADTLDMPVGSIGPTRQRCLHKLRRDPDVARMVLEREGNQ